MAYTALYRKFRPNNFEEVKGQDHIVTTLKNQLSYDRIGHAYLFCGTRGTGKTSIAKLFAKAVNCENLVKGNPCGECPSCISIKDQTSMNVIEIDAASNNGVDNIREIIDEVKYSPTTGKYKIYIIDEVHMLSTGAFNALLKTLEEPPSYCIFILATTEVHKIPITILSRCQRYDFKRISVDDIVSRLDELIAFEGIKADEKAIRYIARCADGALRDALSILDQCVAFYLGEELTYDKVLSVLGTADYETFATLLRLINAGNVDGCINLLDDIVLSGRDLSLFTEDFSWYLRDLLLAKQADCPEEILEASSEQIEFMKHEAMVFEADQIIRYLKIMSELSNRIKYSSQKRILIEVELVKMCRPESENNQEALLDRVRVLEQTLRKVMDGNIKISSSNFQGMGEELPDELPEDLDAFLNMGSSMGTFASAITGTKKAIKPKKDPPKALTEDIKLVASKWTEIINKLPTKTKLMLLNGVPTAGDDNHLVFVTDVEFDYNMLRRNDTKAEIEEIIEQTIEKKVAVDISFKQGGKEALKEEYDITKLLKGTGVPVEVR